MVVRYHYSTAQYSREYIKMVTVKKTLGNKKTKKLIMILEFQNISFFVDYIIR